MPRLRALLPSALSLVGMLLLVFTLGACASARPRKTPPARPTTPTAPVADYTATETFDVGAYPLDTPAQGDAAVRHSVPAALLNGTAADSLAAAAPRPAPGPPRPGVLHTVTGYRVQIFQSASKDEADRRVADAIGWWRRTQTGSPEVYTAFRAPYYRVRMGNFATRSEASQFAAQLASAFPSALLVQDRVQVRD